MNPRLVKITAAALALSTALSACAGRTPNPVSISQPQDATASCVALRAETEANSARIDELDSEQAWKIAQNAVTFSVGLVLFWPLLFASDFQDAAGIEQEALKRRNDYLVQVAGYKHCGSSEPVFAANTTGYAAATGTEQANNVIVRTYLPGGRLLSTTTRAQ